MLIFHEVLPVPKWTVLISGFIFILVGIFAIGQGVSIGSTVLMTSFTNNIGLLFSLFGIGLSINMIVGNVRLSMRRSDS